MSFPSIYHTLSKQVCLANKQVCLAECQFLRITTNQITHQNNPSTCNGNSIKLNNTRQSIYQNPFIIDCQFQPIGWLLLRVIIDHNVANCSGCVSWNKPEKYLFSLKKTELYSLKMAFRYIRVVKYGFKFEVEDILCELRAKIKGS